VNARVAPSIAPLTPRAEAIARSVLLLLVGISAVGPIALNGVLPANSAVMGELATSYALAQMVLTVYLFATLVSQIVLGPAADRHGRRPVMLFGLVVFTLGSIGCAFAPSIESLLLGRFIQGFGGATCMFLPRTIVRDVYPRDRAASVIGYMTTAMMLAPMFGPALGGWTTDAASWRWMYGGLAMLGALFVALAWRFLPETRRTAEVSAAPAGDPAGIVASPLGSLLRERAFIGYALLMTGSVGVYYTFLAGAPYVAMESRGLAASAFGIWFAMVAVGYLTGNLIAGRFSEQVGGTRMIAYALLPFFLGIGLFWALAGWSHPLGLFLPMQLVAISNGMALPNMISGAMSVRPSLAASASGLAGGLQTAFGVALTVAVGVLLPLGDLWLQTLATLCALVTVSGLVVASAARR